MSNMGAPEISWKSKVLRVIAAGAVEVLILVLAVSSVAAPSSSEIPSYSKACLALQKLTEHTGASRERWLKVIDSFLSIHQTAKDHHIANRCLFLAGRASLDLYRRSGRMVDLDQAICHLSRFSNLNRRGPYLILGLRELKEAHSLKRKVLARSSRNSDDAAEANRGLAGANDLTLRSSAQPIKNNSPTATADASSNAFSSRAYLAPPVSQKYLRGPFNNPLGPACDDSKMASTVPFTSAARQGGAAVKGGTGAGIETPVPDSSPTSSLQGQHPKASSHDNPPLFKSASLPNPTASDILIRKKMATQSTREFVIAIDPGHGGKDPGAISQDGRLKEKDLTLEIAKKLKTILETKDSSLRVVLTRSDDRHLSLEERTAVANSADADLFISIHCNADADSRSSGIETYYLSKASSKGAMKVAARENGIPLSKMSDIEATLLDLMVTSKKSESAKLATAVHDSLCQKRNAGRTAARDRGVRQAPFYVLLRAKMPAVLVECAFISNKRERGKLTSSTYLASIADKIADGATNYLKELDAQ